MKKIKTMAQFQAVMREIEERENLFVGKMFAIETRLFTTEHKSEIDFYCVAHERGSERYRVYHFYSSTMEEPHYVWASNREEAYEMVKDDILKVSL